MYLNLTVCFQSEGCGLHKFFISINLILCVLVSVVAILPKVQEYQPRSGLLQSSVVSLYTLYLTWSAMSNTPGMLLNLIYVLNKLFDNHFNCRQQMQAKFF